MKYSLTNILKSSVLEHGRRQGQRIFVFKEGKNQLGMGDYQVCSYTGFHRHMALVFMGLYLVLKAKAMEGIPPTLTAADVLEVMRLMNSAIYRPDYQKSQLQVVCPA